MNKIPVSPVLLLLVGYCSLQLFGIAYAQDCPNGYVWDRMSGVGCKQENCNDIEHAHWSSVGYCVCGSSGSINENPEDPNKECAYGQDYKACPGCVYACVGLDEDCPDEKTEEVTDDDSGMEVEETDVDEGDADEDEDLEEDADDDEDIEEGEEEEEEELEEGASVPLSTTGSATIPGRTCRQECDKLKRGGEFDEVLEASGIYPNCKCVVDNKNKNNILTQTIQQDGDKRTIYTYDPNSGNLIKKVTISIQAEKERIRQSLGFKYDEEKIRELLDDAKINGWFDDKMSNIKTDAGIVSFSFWWQHIVALLDHGYGNSADFVDTYQFGRCGDSMQWLKRDMAGKFGLTGPKDKKSEIMLSITGEKYGNIVNHTALIIRPTNYSNIEWADIVTTLTTKTQQGGLTEADIKALDPQLLDAKILDPYFKKRTTVREFIKGWSVIKIS